MCVCVCASGTVKGCCFRVGKYPIINVLTLLWQPSAERPPLSFVVCSQTRNKNERTRNETQCSKFYSMAYILHYIHICYSITLKNITYYCRALHMTALHIKAKHVTALHHYMLAPYILKSYNENPAGAMLQKHPIFNLCPKWELKSPWWLNR